MFKSLDALFQTVFISIYSFNSIRILSAVEVLSQIAGDSLKSKIDPELAFWNMHSNGGDRELRSKSIIN